MKSPLRKLHGFMLQTSDGKEKKEPRKPAKLDELVEATKDLQDMRSCYESIQSAAATIANNAYELSIALEELGSCLLEKVALNDNEDSGRALMMIGKAQFELHRLFNVYRAHIFQTMAKPSKSLLRQLEIVEDMKFLCDEKREFYKSMLVAYKEKRRSRLVKDGNFSSKELQQAQIDFEEAAALFVFRLKSLKQGQFRSLLTQAARHHAAQLSFFRKGLKTLEVVESHVKLVAEQQHIDHQFSDLEDDDNDDDDSSYYDDDYDDNYGSGDRELSSECKQNYRDQDVISLSRNLLEENTDRSPTGFLRHNGRRPDFGSQSAPIFADKKFDRSEKTKEARSSYVLPTPSDDSNPTSTSPAAVRLEDKGEWPKQLWHSSPLEAKKPVEVLRESELLIPKRSPKTNSQLKDTTKSGPIITLSSSPERLSTPQTKPYSASVPKISQRQAFSGPLTSTSSSSRPKFSVTDYRPFVEHPPLVSLASKHAPKPQSSVSSAVPSTAATLPKSSPIISELHELPRPPIGSEKMLKPSCLIGYSGPLISKGQGLAASNITVGVSHKTSPLPTPPAPMNRSFSIPSSDQRTPKSSVARMADAPKILDSAEEVASPPLTPVNYYISSYINSIRADHLSYLPF